ncbi:hypothetical protein J6590_096120 [Homalodisca vitripennis]|nr:hypothetical protein J6590_096120 [Homalodisca vitripennis]
MAQQYLLLSLSNYLLLSNIRRKVKLLKVLRNALAFLIRQIEKTPTTFLGLRRFRSFTTSGPNNFWIQ